MTPRLKHKARVLPRSTSITEDTATPFIGCRARCRSVGFRYLRLAINQSARRCSAFPCTSVLCCAALGAPLLLVGQAGEGPTTPLGGGLCLINLTLQARLTSPAANVLLPHKLRCCIASLRPAVCDSIDVIPALHLSPHFLLSSAHTCVKNLARRLHTSFSVPLRQIQSGSHLLTLAVSRSWLNSPASWGSPAP